MITRRVGMTAVNFVRWIGFGCLLLTVLSLSACGGGSSDGIHVSETRGDGKDLSSDDKAAADFVRSKLAQHWVEAPDGWTTQFQQYNMLGQVMPDQQPNTLYKQVRKLSFTIVPENLTEAMKLNGTDYRVTANFKDSPVRYFHLEASYDAPQGWGNWKDSSMMFTQLAVERRNGQWLVSDSDLFQGIRPDPSSVPR
jgi:hypothetical protein